MEAHNNLGARYMLLGDPARACGSFKTAQELDPGSPLVQANLAIALLTMGDPKGAASGARRAIQLDPSNLKAHYILGLALYTQEIFTDETVSMLSKSQERFPNAAIVLAQVHANRGQQELARKSLRECIRSGNKENKQRAEAMLAVLK